MTSEERKNPDLLASSPNRRKRIASGSGYKEADVAKLVSDFQKMRSLMQQMGQGNFPGMPGMMGGMGNAFAGGGDRPAPPGWRGYNAASPNPNKKKKKDKKKKGFGTL
jgi:signal recognition particle subunit SRP54